MPACARQPPTPNEGLRGTWRLGHPRARDCGAGAVLHVGLERCVQRPVIHDRDDSVRHRDAARRGARRGGGTWSGQRRCKAWSQAERWNAGGGMCALADRLPGESYAQAFAREESESDTALCPVCDKWASRCWEGESCACARGKARCDLHVSVSEAHNAVFVCAGKLPVKLGRGRRRRANRRRARDRDELLAPQ